MGNFKIREFRKAMGLYQDELATILGLTQSNLSRYETNGVSLSEDSLNKLRERFGRDTVDTYLNEVPTMAQEESDFSRIPEDVTTSELIRIITRQNDTICRQIDRQDELNQQLMAINNRLISLLEKFQFE